MEPKLIGEPYGQQVGPPPEEPKQSGLGTASCLTSFLAVGSFGLLLLSAVVNLGLAGGVPADFTSTGVFFVIVAFILCIVALTLGIAALFQKGRKKAFAVVGTLISAGIILFFVGLYISRATG